MATNNERVIVRSSDGQTTAWTEENMCRNHAIENHLTNFPRTAALIPDNISSNNDSLGNLLSSVTNVVKNQNGQDNGGNNHDPTFNKNVSAIRVYTNTRNIRKEGEKETEPTEVDTDDMPVDERDDTTAKTQHFQNTSVVTTSTNVPGKKDSNKKFWPAFDYCRSLLEQLSIDVDILKPKLDEFHVPVENADFRRDDLDGAISRACFDGSKKTMMRLWDILQEASDNIPPSTIEHNKNVNQGTVRRGQDPSETSDLRILTLEEQKEDGMSEQIQTSPQSPLPSGPQETVQSSQLVTMQILEQPQPYWHTRYINDFVNGERSFIKTTLQWQNLDNNDRHPLYILVQPITYNGSPHPSTVFVPLDTASKTEPLPSQEIEVTGQKKKKSRMQPRSNTLDDLIFNDQVKFDKVNKTILLPVTKEEETKGVKTLEMSMLKLTKENTTKVVFGNGKDEKQWLKLSRMRIGLCRQTNPGDFDIVSEFIHTDPIEERKGSTALAIYPSKIIPNQLCENGGEEISVVLNTESEKAGFTVYLNGGNPVPTDFRMTGKTIYFTSLSKTTPEQSHLRVIIFKTNLRETIMQDKNPADPVQDLLLDINLPYVTHSVKGDHRCTMCNGPA